MNKKIAISITIIILLLIVAGIYLFRVYSLNRTPSISTKIEPTKFIFGRKFIVEEKAIGKQGGEILVQAPNTPISGIKIVFPPGSVPDNTKVEIGYYEGGWKLAEGVRNKFTIPLILNLDKQLNQDGQPIEIHKKADMAFQIDRDTGRLHVMDSVNGVTYTFRSANIITLTNVKK